MTVITLQYPHLAFNPFNKNAITPRLHFTRTFHTSLFNGTRRIGKIAMIGTNPGSVIEKEQEFKPVFDEYLKAMETVKIRREKRKSSKEIVEDIVEDEINVKEDEGKKLWVKKKLDPKGVRRNAEEDAEFQEQSFGMKRVVPRLKEGEGMKKWTRKEPGSGYKEVQVDSKFKEQSFNMKRAMPGMQEDEVVKKWTRKEPDSGYKEVQMDSKFKEQSFNMKRVMPSMQEDEVVNKWARKKPGYKEVQMDSKFKDQSFNMERVMPDLKKDGGMKKWTRKEPDFEGVQMDAKFKEKGFRGYGMSSNSSKSFVSDKERVLDVKKSIRRSEHDGDDDMEIERAAFKSLEEFPDVCDQPRVSRVDMEERIQKLAKCLNGASIDTPEWNFSKMMRSAKIRFADFSIIRLIQILGNYGNWRQVLQVIEWMQSRERFKSNRIRNIYTTALDALGKARRPVEALNMFHTMQQQMASYPDRVAYHCIAVTLGQAGHMRELFHVIDTMRSLPKKKLATGVLQKWDPRLEPDIIVYNAVLNACVRQKNLEGAFWVLQQLKQQGQQPNSVTYGLVMEVMLACEKYNLVHEFFKKMRRSFIPNSLTYKVLVNTLWKEGKVDEAILTVKEMEKRGIIGSAALYYDLARCLCSAGRCEEAIVQIEKVCKVANKPLVVTYTGLIQASLDSGEIESGIYIFKHMHKFCSPNLVTSNVMLKAYLDHQMFEEAKQLFYKLLENGNHITSKVDSRHVVLPDIHTFNLMLNACLVNQKWDDLEFVYTKMLQHGYYFNAKRHSHMILEAYKAGKVNMLETTWKHLIEGDQIPPPPLVQEMFCMKLEQDDYAAAFSCLKCLPSTESHKYSRNSWVTRFRDNPNLFQEETLLRIIDMVSTASIGNEEPNIILLNLMRSCKETLKDLKVEEFVML